MLSIASSRMAMGARRISAARVLTRRAAAIETLGSATVLCTDKTGTLTENPMSIAELRLNHLAEAEHLHGPDWELVQAYGLRPVLLAMSHVWRADTTGRSSSSRLKGHQKRSSISATSTPTKPGR